MSFAIALTQIGSSAGSWSLRKPCPASGYRLMSWSMPAAVSTGSRRSGVPRTPRSPIPGAVAGNDRAGIGQGALGVLGEPAVVHARRREAVAGRQHQREPAAHAEADHADLARAALLPGQPGARRVEVAERPRPVAHEGDQAPHPPSPVLKVWRHDKE